MRASRSNLPHLETPSKNLRKIKGGRFIHQVRKMRIVTHSYRSDVHVYDAPTGAGSSARILLFDRARRRSLQLWSFAMMAMWHSAKRRPSHPTARPGSAGPETSRGGRKRNKIPPSA